MIRRLWRRIRIELEMFGLGLPAEERAAIRQALDTTHDHTFEEWQACDQCQANDP